VRRSRAALIGGAVAALVIAGTAAAGPIGRGTPDPWRATTTAAGRHAQSPFGRRVLADGVVSPAEYAEATNLVITCAKGRGAVLTAEQRYGLLIFSSTGQDYSAALDACETGDLATVRQLYEARYKDPRKEGDQVYLRCLSRVGLLTGGSAAPAEPLSATLDRLMSADAPAATLGLVDRCLYDPAGRTWQ
jgi:hypothetical protein